MLVTQSLDLWDDRSNKTLSVDQNLKPWRQADEGS